MWVLVIAILGNGSAHPPAMLAVPGFTTEATCLAAASACLRGIPDVVAYNHKKSAICVKA